MTERGRGSEAGQASIELIAGVPVLLLAAVACLPLLAAGYALTLADGAAEAGALARSAGEPAAPAVEKALPGWAQERFTLGIRGDEITVTLRPPSPFAAVAERLSVSSEAWAHGAPGR
jgi:hypothetical protein